VVAQLLTEIDGIERASGLIMIAATNRPEMLDPALLRPGRFDVKITIGMPDASSRRKILQVHTHRKPLVDFRQVENLVQLTDGLVGAEIEALCNRASLNAVRRAVDMRLFAEKEARENGSEFDKSRIKLQLTAEDFQIALKEIRDTKNQITQNE
jgi:transitional endoplasmic reticulum ATPase